MLTNAVFPSTVNPSRILSPPPPPPAPALIRTLLVPLRTGTHHIALVGIPHHLGTPAAQALCSMVTRKLLWPVRLPPPLSSRGSRRGRDDDSNYNTSSFSIPPGKAINSCPSSLPGLQRKLSQVLSAPPAGFGARALF